MPFRFWFLEQWNENPQFAIVQVIIITFSICSHEYMHARAALWQGDDTAKLLGHLTLNPLKQMGPMSLIMMFVIGIAFGRVPVNPSRFKGRHSDAIVSFAGPLTNLVLFFLFCCGIIAVVYIDNSADNIFMRNTFLFGAILNGALFLLNMVPVPPLDGHGVLCSFIPQLKTTSSEFINGASFFILIIVFFSAEYLFMGAAMGVKLTLMLAGIKVG